MMDERNNNARLDVHAAEGLLTIKNQAQERLLAGCWAGLTLTGGTAYTTAGPVGIEQGPLGGLLVHSPGSSTRPTLRWSIEPGEYERSVQLRLEVENTTAQPLAVERIDVLVAPEGFRAAAAA